MLNIPQGGFRPSELIVFSSEHHKLSGWNSTMFVDQVAKRNVPNTIIEHLSGCTKTLLGVEGEQHIIDLVEKSVFKDARLIIKLFDSYHGQRSSRYNPKVVFFIHGQLGTVRYRNRKAAHPFAWQRLYWEIANYLNDLMQRQDA